MALIDLCQDYRYDVWFDFRAYFYTRRLCEAGMLHIYDFMYDHNQVVESYNRMRKEYEAYKKRVLKLES